MPDIQPLRLSQLTSNISKALTDAFDRASFWVIADVTNHTFRPDKNYHSFDLVEKAAGELIARVQTKAWGRGSASIDHFQQVTGQKFTDNIHVLVNVSINYHAVYGLQLNLNEVDTSFTLGALEQQRLATLQKLVLENPESIQKVGDTYLTRNKQLVLNSVIQHIAVISSSTSAGWQDFKHTLENNAHGYRFTTDDYFALVQGENNAQQLASRLIDVFQSNKPYDAVVIIRGGGAQTDFLLFDTYIIGKAIAKFPIPVITGIGHQKNETIADMMANTSTKTPTKAAEFIINHNRSFEHSVNTLQKQIIIKSQQRISANFQLLSKQNSVIVNNTRNVLSDYKDGLYRITSSLLTKPRIITYNRLNDIQRMSSNIHTFIGHYVKNQRGNLDHFASTINIASPMSTLRRGFALIKSGGSVTSDPDKLVIGTDIEIILATKSVVSTVKSKQEHNGKEFDI